MPTNGHFEPSFLNIDDIPLITYGMIFSTAIVLAYATFLDEGIPEEEPVVEVPVEQVATPSPVVEPTFEEPSVEVPSVEEVPSEVPSVELPSVEEVPSEVPSAEEVPSVESPSANPSMAQVSPSPTLELPTTEGMAQITKGGRRKRKTIRKK